MEVKIGVLHVSREVTLESTQSPEDIETAVAAAFNGDDPVLALTDERGRRVLIPADRIGYVEIGSQLDRRVGFSPE